MAEQEAAKGIASSKLSKSMDMVGKFSTETGFWLEYHWFEPVTTAAHDEMIEVLLHRGDLAAAESVAREALQLSPWWTNPDDFRRLAEILRARGFAADAASLTQTARRLAEQDLQKPLQSTSSSIELAQERQWRIDRMARLLCGVGRQEDAIKVLYAGLDELPADPVLSYRLGSLLADGKMLSEAQRILRTALARWPESADLYFAMSKSQSDKDRPAVIDLVQRAVELAPRNSSFHDDLAARLIAAGEFDIASKAIERALRAGCRSGPLYYRLSQVRKHYGDREGALEAGRAAVSLEPQSAYLIDHLASLLLDAGEFAEAALIVKSALERGLESSSLFYRWSLILQRLHQDDEAVAAASKAAARDPSQSYLKEHLASVLRGRGDVAEAEQILRTALIEHPEQAGLHYQLSRLLSDTKRTSEALKFAREAVRLSPERIYFHENLVNQLVAEERYSEAEEGINYAIEKGLNSGQLMYRLSQLQARHDNLDGALHAAQSALRLEPTQAYLHEHLVGILFDSERFDEAEAMVEQALQQGVESGALYYRKSRLLHRSDRKQEALLAASLAVSMDPNKTYLRDHYAAILKDVEQHG
jgi:tetratricopeptide (TPR) repeat protein